jgi:hypothetical protein
MVYALREIDLFDIKGNYTEEQKIKIKERLVILQKREIDDAT